MNRCAKCGAEFEGRFCPECGTEYVGLPGEDKKICPVCGAVVIGKYCSVCGTEYGAAKKCERCGREYTGNFCPYCGTRDAAAKKGRRLYWGTNSFIPAVYLLFTVLLLVSLLLPVATEASAARFPGEMGGIVYADGIGDIGTFFLIFFCYINLPVCILMSFLGWIYGGRKAGALSLYQVVGIVDMILMLVGFIGGCVLLSRLSGVVYEGRTYSITPGAAPVLITVSSAVCFVVELVLVIATASLTKNNAAYAEAEKSNRARLMRRINAGLL